MREILDSFWQRLIQDLIRFLLVCVILAISVCILKYTTSLVLTIAPMAGMTAYFVWDFWREIRREWKRGGDE